MSSPGYLMTEGWTVSKLMVQDAEVMTGIIHAVIHLTDRQDGLQQVDVMVEVIHLTVHEVIYNHGYHAGYEMLHQPDHHRRWQRDVLDHLLDAQHLCHLGYKVQIDVHGRGNSGI